MRSANSIGAKLEINVGQFDLMTAQQLAVRITIALAELHGPALVLDGALEAPLASAFLPDRASVFP